MADLGLTDKDVEDLMGEVKEENENYDDIDEKEERGSLFKMTELSRNLLNSSGGNDKSDLADDIDLDKLLNSGMRSDAEMTFSQNIKSSQTPSKNERMSFESQSCSMSGIKDSDFNMDSSLKFDPIQEDNEEHNFKSNSTIKLSKVENINRTKATIKTFGY